MFPRVVVLHRHPSGKLVSKVFEGEFRVISFAAHEDPGTVLLLTTQGTVIIPNVVSITPILSSDGIGLESAIRAFLHYSLCPVGYAYSGLTDTEETLVTREAFDTLVGWLHSEPMNARVAEAVETYHGDGKCPRCGDSDIKAVADAGPEDYNVTCPCGHKWYGFEPGMDES